MTQYIKRGSGYLIRIPRGRDASGKRLYHNQTVRGNKRDAERIATRILREMHQGIYVEPSSLSVSEFLSTWLSDVAAQKVRTKTFEDYRSLSERQLMPRLGNFTLAQLSTSMIDRAYAEMRSASLSPRTIGYAHSVLHNALDHAVARGLIAKNPAKGAIRPRNEHREMNCLTPDEAARFLAAAKGTRFEALWIILLTAGLRPAEALGLKWADVDGERLRVQRSLVWLRSGKAEEVSPKTQKGKRTVHLPPSAVAALKEHKAKQNVARLSAGSSWATNDYVFCNAHGGALEWRVIARRHFKKLLRAAEIDKPLRPYDLRHTCATLLLASGEHPKVVSERLGHAKVALTLDVYSHVLPDMQQGAADRLEHLLFATS